MALHRRQMGSVANYPKPTSAPARLPRSQRRWPSRMPTLPALARNAPTVRFINLEIFFTRTLSFEYRRSSATCARVQLTRFDRLFFVLAI